MLEAIGRFENLIGNRLNVEYVETPRRGDHIFEAASERLNRPASPP